MNSSVTLAQSVSDSPSIDPPTTKLVSVNKDGTASGNRSSFDPTLSANGRFVTFVSTATDLVDIPTGTEDVYVRDLRTGITRLISVNRHGTADGNGVSDLSTLSADGRFVAFQGVATDLVDIPTGNGGQGDVYMRGIRSSGELE